jgi:hypothetical protein
MKREKAVRRQGFDQFGWSLTAASILLGLGAFLALALVFDLLYA